VKPSTFRGLELDAQTRLPVAFAKSGTARRYQRNASNGALIPARALGFREAIALKAITGSDVGTEWLATLDGDYVRRDQLLVVDAPTNLPQWARDKSVWVDVSIESQVLVAYEGPTAKYITLVSTGVDGLSDPLTSKATKQGVFRIVSKHLTATMAGEDEAHSYEMREVPWVQYFSEGYALHAAYWHDGFGKPRSHGCVNLSPIDARWLFHFTNPGVPQGWHGRTIAADNAIVYVHP